LEVTVAVEPTLHDIESKREPIVSEARMAITVDDDVFLCGAFSGERRDIWLGTLTGLRWLWTIRMEWRYCNPWAASASFGVF